MPEGARNLKLTIVVSVASVLVVASALVILSDGRANSLLSESYSNRARCCRGLYKRINVVRLQQSFGVDEGEMPLDHHQQFNRRGVQWALADAHIKDFDAKRSSDTNEYPIYQRRIYT